MKDFIKPLFGYLETQQRAHKVSGFELAVFNRKSTKAEVKNQTLDAIQRSEDVGVSVRVMTQGKEGNRVGFSFSTSLAPESLLKAGERAIEVAAVMPEDKFHHFNTFKGKTYPKLELKNPRALPFDLSNQVAWAKELESQCRKSDPRIAAVRSASVSHSVSGMDLIDSEGTLLSQEGEWLSASITCKADGEGGESQMGGDFGFGHSIEDLDLKAIGIQAAEYATELLGAKATTSMNCPVVLRNSVVADLIEFLSESFSAEAIDKKRSMLKDKLGQKIFSPHLTLTNHALLPKGLGSSPFDGEGTPCGKIALIENGTFKQMLTDLYTAQKLGQPLTGSTSRSIKSPPQIGTANLILEAGQKSLEDLCDGISRGVLITDLMGLHTANSVTGDFSLGASGILIIDGKLTTPIKGFAVAGNVLEVFEKVTDIGKDHRFFGSVSTPSLRIRDLAISGD